jgi:hypothetical protein
MSFIGAPGWLGPLDVVPAPEGLETAAWTGAVLREEATDLDFLFIK